METITVGTLLGRRLDRLRSSPLADPVGGRVGRVDHAAALAAAMGGVVVSNELGSLVVLETITELPIEIGRLASLPYPIDPLAPLVCLDLETTGLATAAGTLPFLVGVGVWQEGRLRVHQLVLPDHSSERALLALLRTLLPADGWLVTYNGKCFDWPLLTARYRLHRSNTPPYAGHLDLLPIAR